MRMLLRADDPTTDAKLQKSTFVFIISRKRHPIQKTLTDPTTMFHVKLSIFALLSIGCQAQSLRPRSSRNLLEAIAGYVPTTLVTDQVSYAFDDEMSSSDLCTISCVCRPYHSSECYRPR
jgi:hypothetical protein